MPCVIADAWTLVVEREVEWDERNRAEAVAAVIAERVCPRCGQRDSQVLEDDSLAGPPHLLVNGRRFRVEKYRCLACAARETVDRDNDMAHENYKPKRGRMGPRDGVWFTAAEAHN